MQLSCLCNWLLASFFFVLFLFVERVKPVKWKWVQAKPTGILPSPRGGFSIAVSANNHAYAFGGVQDEDADEESLTSVFHNDLYFLELENGRWGPITLHGKESKDRRRRRKAKDGGEIGECDDETDDLETLENTSISDDAAQVIYIYIHNIILLVCRSQGHLQITD